MQTLTVTKARQNLGGWLKRAERGEEIGVIYGDSIFELRKVRVHAEDYAETEYGLTAEEVRVAAARLVAQVRTAKTRTYQPGMLTRAHRTHQAVSRMRKKTA